MKTKKRSSLYAGIAQKAGEQRLTGKVSGEIDLGKTIRNLRMARKLKGVDLCKKAGDLDPRTLTAIEKGRIKNPSLKTLQSVSRGLGVVVSDLFRQEEMEEERNFFQGTQKGAYEVHFPSKGIKAVGFSPFIKDFFCGKLILGPNKRFEETLLNHRHPIFASTLVGRFEAAIEDKTLQLREGENVFFNGAMRHSFHNPMRRDSVLLLVTAPSFFK